MDFIPGRLVELFACALVSGFIFGLITRLLDVTGWPRRVKTTAGEIVIFKSGATFAIAADGLVYRVLNGVPVDVAPGDPTMGG